MKHFPKKGAKPRKFKRLCFSLSGQLLLVNALLNTFSTKALEASDLLVFSKGPFSARPQVGAYIEYSDNILYRQIDPISDLKVGVSPGIRLLLGDDLPDANKLILTYQMDEGKYIDHTELDSTQHHISFLVTYKTTRATLTGRDQLDFLSSPLSTTTGLGTLKVDRTVLSDKYELEYRFSEKLGAFTRIDHQSTDYQGRINLFDLRELEFAVGGDWFFSDQTRAFTEIYYSDSALSSNLGVIEPPGKSGIGSFVGMRGRFTEKLNGTVKAGYEIASIEASPVAGSRQIGNPVVQFDVGFQATEKISLGMVYSRRQDVSVEFSSSVFTTDYLGISFAYQIGATGRLRLNSIASYALSDYDPAPAYSSRTDANIRFRTGLTWNFQTWLSSTLSYEFLQRTSTLQSPIDYTVNRVVWAWSVGY